MKMFPGYIYLFKKVCVGLVGWFLCALLFPKIIFSMKGCYGGFQGT